MPGPMLEITITMQVLQVDIAMLGLDRRVVWALDSLLYGRMCRISIAKDIESRRRTYRKCRIDDERGGIGREEVILSCLRVCWRLSWLSEAL